MEAGRITNRARHVVEYNTIGITVERTQQRARLHCWLILVAIWQALLRFDKVSTASMVELALLMHRRAQQRDIHQAFGKHLGQVLNGVRADAIRTVDDNGHRKRFPR